MSSAYKNALVLVHVSVLEEAKPNLLFWRFVVLNTPSHCLTSVEMIPCVHILDEILAVSINGKVPWIFSQYACSRSILNLVL